MSLSGSSMHVCVCGGGGGLNEISTKQNRQTEHTFTFGYIVENYQW